jgi:hypothetical protein
MRRLLFVLFTCLLLLLAACAVTGTQTDAPTAATPEVVVAEQTVLTVTAPDPWTAEEVDAIARTLSGECYEDKPGDKRLVAEVILNRVSNAQWGDTVTEVVTAKKQFHGYWKPSRDISDNDREIATQALRDWYANDQQALSEYLYFEAGPNRENVFRKNY